MAAELDALYAAVLRDPADDAVRAVWADALIDAGDPRGELVALQLAHARGEVTRASSEREHALVAKLGPAWAGAKLARAFDRFAFDRGVLVGCEYQRDLGDVDSLVDDPAWATVTTASELRDIRLLVHPRGHVSRSRRLLVHAAFELVRLARDQACPLVELGIYDVFGDQLEGLAFEPARFPRLEVFGIGSLARSTSFLARSPIVEHVPRLRVDNLDAAQGIATAAKRAGALRVIECGVTNNRGYDLGWRVELSRDTAPGKFTRAHLACFTGPPAEIAKRGRLVLKELTGLGIRDLAIDIGAGTTFAPTAARALQSDLDAMALDRVTLSWAR